MCSDSVDNSLLDENAKVLICDIVSCADKDNKLNANGNEGHIKGRIVFSRRFFLYFKSFTFCVGN